MHVCGKLLGPIWYFVHVIFSVLVAWTASIYSRARSPQVIRLWYNIKPKHFVTKLLYDSFPGEILIF